MQVVDTSVIVRAVISSDAQQREHLQDAIAASARVIAHTLAEAYSTLTRLPQPFRLSPQRCFAYLSGAFTADPLTLSASGYLRVLRLVGEHGVSGGAIYDCLIAQTAQENHAQLLTLDARAASNYALVGASYRILQ